MAHKSGFVNIVGSPNVGKSTLMNRLVGERVSIVTSKAQTTRHRIIGIVNDEDYQVVFSDTPGVVNAAYKLHENMMDSVQGSIKDADVLLFVTDTHEKEMNHRKTLDRIKKLEIPVFCLINKIDLSEQDRVFKRIAYWKEQLPNAKIYPISALHDFNIESVWTEIVSHIPESPPYYDKEDLTDRPLRFFISEIIREKIFELCQKEIPYSCQVLVEEYKEDGRMIRIRAQIIVERDSQKGIIIGKGGEMLQKIGKKSRIDLENFLDRKVFLENFVKVDKDWRSSEQKLKKYGY
ncbi:MAG: GTPase Era [Flavobacteriales bacterium]|jgi:GTP-binding protein Era|nr:GTPase Era [Flavobacteriales bacterium]MDB4340289.1 GTPase Era [Crocinitomicaceae bacterium]MBT5932496.1 GTPase Era [Flavobacteriales bacterium]MDC0272287.1 GTPase Era [Crocinitomicaceae bacterium]MDC0459580.1 GTPase Era [Crocinitomicaceae bacterium]